MIHEGGVKRRRGRKPEPSLGDCSCISSVDNEILWFGLGRECTLALSPPPICDAKSMQMFLILHRVCLYCFYLGTQRPRFLGRSGLPHDPPGLFPLAAKPTAKVSKSCPGGSDVSKNLWFAPQMWWSCWWSADELLQVMTLFSCPATLSIHDTRSAPPPRARKETPALLEHICQWSTSCHALSFCVFPLFFHPQYSLSTSNSHSVHMPATPSPPHLFFFLSWLKCQRQFVDLHQQWMPEKSLWQQQHCRRSRKKWEKSTPI